ncbi:tail fiber protein [Bacillus phage YungSlug]|nr:tail fiber protein [Bacillus phage YungSlug]
MKLVIFGDDKTIYSVEEKLVDVVVDGKKVTWDDGEIPEVGAHFIVLEDSVSLPKESSGFLPLTDAIIALDKSKELLPLKQRLALANKELEQTQKENAQLQDANKTLTSRLSSVERTSVQLMNMVMGMQGSNILK